MVCSFYCRGFRDQRGKGPRSDFLSLRLLLCKGPHVLPTQPAMFVDVCVTLWKGAGWSSKWFSFQGTGGVDRVRNGLAVAMVR